MFVDRIHSRIVYDWVCRAFHCGPDTLVNKIEEDITLDVSPGFGRHGLDFI